jgi:hypothetical protein
LDGLGDRDIATSQDETHAENENMQFKWTVRHCFKFVGNQLNDGQKYNGGAISIRF